MPKRDVLIEGIGEVSLSKRRGATHLRISITAAGKVRVSMPYWTPYAAGIAFAKSRREWIAKHLSEHKPAHLEDSDLIGKAHRLNFKPAGGARTTTKVTATEVVIYTNQPRTSQPVQDAAGAASEKALKAEASVLLPQRLEALAKTHGFSYKSVRVRKLTSRWGSCSSQKNITLSYFLIQLPWQYIDHVLVHELVHTEHLHHGKAFWERFESVMPNARSMRKEMRRYHPRIIPLKNSTLTLEKNKTLA